MVTFSNTPKDDGGSLRYQDLKAYWKSAENLDLQVKPTDQVSSEQLLMDRLYRERLEWMRASAQRPHITTSTTTTNSDGITRWVSHDGCVCGVSPYNTDAVPAQRRCRCSSLSDVKKRLLLYRVKFHRARVSEDRTTNLFEGMCLCEWVDYLRDKHGIIIKY